MGDTFNLTGYLPYLLNRTGSRIASAFTGEIRRFGITLPMWRAMAALNHEDNQRLSRLSELTSVEISTLSRQVGTLKKLGLVQRRQSNGPDADSRAISLSLTLKGREITEQIIPIAVQYETVALAGLSDAEVQTLKELLARLYDNMAELEGSRAAAE